MRLIPRGMLGCCLVGVAWLCCPTASDGENWPQFRGPNGQGRSSETALPIKWSLNENIAWKTSIPGEGWSSPIVWDDQVFVSTATEGGTSCRLLSLDRLTGRVLWNKEVFRQSTLRKEQRNSFATPTPATDGERVYVCYGEGGFAAVNFAGDVLWTNHDYKFYGQHGLGTSPIVYQNFLIMARDGSSEGPDKALGWQKPWENSYVLALDAKTGQERWRGRRGLSRISHGAPAIWEHDSVAEVVSEAGDVLQGFDLRTGERLWSHEVIGEGKVPSTTLGDGLVFAAGGWGGKETIKAFRLGARGDLGERELVWEQAKGTPKVPSLLYVRPHLFTISDGGVATCLDAVSGEVHWQRRLDGSYSASPIYAAGRVYFLADDGTTTVIEAQSEFHQAAKNPLTGPIQASMAVSQGKLFIRTGQELYCIGTE